MPLTGGAMAGWLAAACGAHRKTSRQKVLREMELADEFELSLAEPGGLGSLRLAVHLKSANAKIGPLQPPVDRASLPELDQGLIPTAEHRAASRKSQKIKRQKAKICAPGHGPGWEGVFAGWPQSKQPSMTQSSMTQFLSGAGNPPPRGIFAARKEMGL